MASSTRAFFAGIGTTFVILGVGFGGGLMVAKTALNDTPGRTRLAAHQIEPARVVLPTTAEAAPTPEPAALPPEPASVEVIAPEQQVEKVDLKKPEAVDTKKADAEERARKKRYAERKARKIAAKQKMDTKHQIEPKQQLEATPETEPARAPQPAMMAYGWEDQPRQISFFGN